MSTTVPQSSPATLILPAGMVLSVVADAVSSGFVVLLGQPGSEPASPKPVPAGTTVALGPFTDTKQYRVVTNAGALTYSTAVATPVTIVGAIGDVCEIIGAGVPAATAHGALTVNPTGDENGLTFTSVVYGAGANAITIRYVDPGANNAALAVSVLDSAITVSLATDSGGAITSTAAAVKAAIEALPAAAALVTVAIQTADTGSADDGSGVVTAMALAPLAGGAGVGIGVAGIGSRYTDITNGKLYLNSGTKAVPVWKIVTSA